jgi:hypothetical protein
LSRRIIEKWQRQIRVQRREAVALAVGQVKHIKDGHRGARHDVAIT